MQPSTRKGFGSDIPDFTSFHLRLDAALKKEYARVLAVQDKMSPCLLKAGFISSFFVFHFLPSLSSCKQMTKDIFARLSFLTPHSFILF